MLARSYAVLERPARVAAATCSRRCGSIPACSGGRGSRATARRVRRAAMRLALAHRDPGAVPDPALQRARRAARPARALPRRSATRAGRSTTCTSDEWRFEHACVPGRSLRRGGRWLVLSHGLGGRLRRFAPDAVGVGGWNQPAFWRALAYCEDAPHPDRSLGREHRARRTRSGRAPLELAKRALVRGVDGFFVPGQASAEYVRSLGVEPERIAIAPNAVDARVFARAASRRATGRLRVPLRRPARPGEGARRAARAFEDVPGELVLVGSGTAEAELRRAAPATASGSRARCRETRSSPGTGARTPSCCRRARSRGGWC